MKLLLQKTGACLFLAAMLVCWHLAIYSLRDKPGAMYFLLAMTYGGLGVALYPDRRR